MFNQFLGLLSSGTTMSNFPLDVDENDDLTMSNFPLDVDENDDLFTLMS